VFKKQIIMVIDDEEAICLILSQIINTFNYETKCFFDFKTAKDYYKNEHNTVDLILLDFKLKDIQGDKAVKEVLKINPDAKIILMSGYFTSSVSNGSNLGAKRLIQKPVDMKSLENTIREVLDE